MAGDNAFEKLHVEENRKADLSTLLEELNLPPRAVEKVRRNQTKIYIGAIIVVLAVVAWSLYGSYQEKKINQSGSALAIAKKEPSSVRTEALQKVMADFSNTNAALWAIIELAHEDMKNGKYANAADKYTSARREIKEKDPLSPLLTYGIAQALEAEKRYPEALGEYTSLKNTEGYKSVGFPGVARVLEMQGEEAQVLAVYEEYLSTFTGEDLNNPERLLVQEKITYLKAKHWK